MWDSNTKTPQTRKSINHGRALRLPFYFAKLLTVALTYLKRRRSQWEEEGPSGGSDELSLQLFIIINFVTSPTNQNVLETLFSCVFKVPEKLYDFPRRPAHAFQNGVSSIPRVLPCRIYRFSGSHQLTLSEECGTFISLYRKPHHE